MCERIVTALPMTDDYETIPLTRVYSTQTSPPPTSSRGLQGGGWG